MPSLMEQVVPGLPDTGQGPLHRKAIPAARSSTYKLSGITTVEHTERQLSCKVSIEFTLGVPPGADLGNESFQAGLDMMCVLKRVRTYALDAILLA